MSWGFGEDRAVDGVHPVRPGQRHRHGHFLRDQVEQFRDARLALRGEGIDPGAAEQHALRAQRQHPHDVRSEEHTSELQSLMRISYAVFCLKKKKYKRTIQSITTCSPQLTYTTTTHSIPFYTDQHIPSL